MTRLLIALKRSGHTSFNDLPLYELAEAVIDGVPGVINPRTERLEGETVFVSFYWMGAGPPVIDNASLNRFGLCRADANVVTYAITSDEAPRSAVSGSQMRAD
ncbi:MULTISPECIES: hypothetical protein [unclassified Lysobacter]|uniref:hypothetical protein n=1 Tax=unclassified Lysobacter TaxID=2635362 RepID=UPI001BEB1104|nr:MULTISPECIES: hypothetical protein [unclassified Lysobacter]MBT2748249.1 hypothetical protein [Lysobacter sp. ISL-42]MBT2749984.1 hypothetical protein [Lysobacter sp. ISL-50]MBT2781312.1 hypothetical protein [Lysobacter sp. ISL-52]